MTNIKQLRIINDSTIIYLKNIKKCYGKNDIIKDILKDDTCFFKMDKDKAYIVLHEIGIDEKDIERVYSELISRDVYYKLIESKRIKEGQDTIKVSYPIYKSEDLFNNKKQNENKQETEIKKENVAMVEYKESVFKRFWNKIRGIFKGN